MVHSLTCNVFGEQTYLVDHGNGEATVVDPGMSSPQEREAFQSLCKQFDVQPVQVLLTHGHLDHVMGCQWMKDTYGLLPRMHPLDEDTYHRGPIAAQMYGVSMDPLPDPVLDIVPGEAIACGDLVLDVRFVPGHAPGHVAYVNHEHGWILGEMSCFREASAEQICRAACHATFARASSERCTPCQRTWSFGLVTADRPPLVLKKAATRS